MQGGLTMEQIYYVKNATLPVKPVQKYLINAKLAIKLFLEF